MMLFVHDIDMIGHVKKKFASSFSLMKNNNRVFQRQNDIKI